jgi:hypothetical protein
MKRQFHTPKYDRPTKKLSPKQRRTMAMKRHKPISLATSSGQEPFITAFFLILAIALFFTACVIGGEA